MLLGLPAPAPTTSVWRARADALLYGLTLLLAFSLPFEPIRPLGTLAGLDVNHLKLLLLATLCVWLIAGIDASDVLQTTWPAMVFLAVATASALLAPSDRAEAVKFVGRLASGLYALALAARVATSWERVRGVLWAVVLGASLSALLGLGEAVRLGALTPLLDVFKLAPTHVGGDLRVSASFQYATIAAMFFELATPLALILAATARGQGERLLATVIAAMCSAVVVLTITRAGVVALAITLVGMLALAWTRPRWRSLAAPTLLVGCTMGVVLVGVAAHAAGFDARLTTENDWTWYRAEYTAPASLDLDANGPAHATVVAHNTGDAVWTRAGEHPFALAYRWLSADDSAQLDVPTGMVELPRDVAPGDSVTLDVPIAANVPPGDYHLAWGMLQQNVLWFHDRGYPDAETVVRVAPDASQSSPPVAVGQTPRTDTGAGLAPESRTALWSAALHMLVQHPLLGVGPDNFRHLYGTYLGLSAWDERVDANNLYLELLADVGIFGAAAFGLVAAASVLAVSRAMRAQLPAAQAVYVAGLGASILVFFIHGTLDDFLSFTSVYLLFWMVVGLAMRAPGLKVEQRC